MSFPSSPERPPRALSVAEVHALIAHAPSREAGPQRAGDPRKLATATTGIAPALLDVRDHDAYAAGHVAASGHLPAASLEQRRAELPPRHHEVIVLAETAAAARAAATTLAALGYTDSAWLDAPLAALGDTARAQGGPARLWRPAEFLAQVAGAIPRGRAADLAAGSGREAAYLAGLGFEVEAWDEAPEALERAENLARRAGTRIEARVANLEARSFALAEATYALITSFRFLHRPLFPVMARALVRGGHLVYETYRVGQERFGRPRRPQFLLKPDELRSAFAELGLEILRYEEPGPADGPLTARLWARRP